MLIKRGPQRFLGLLLLVVLVMAQFSGFPAQAEGPTSLALELQANTILNELVVFVRTSTGEEMRLVQVPAGQSLEEAMASLRSDPNVTHVEPHYLAELHEDTLTPPQSVDAYFAQQGAQALSTGVDPYFAEQWALTNVKAPSAWATHGQTLATTPESVVVAVVDTGVDYNHPDLAGRILPGRNFARFKANGTSYTTLDAFDDNWHGTHVAGIVAAAYDNGIGIAGVAGPANIKVLPVKVLNDAGSGSIYDIAQGVMWAADQGASVINLSLSIPYDSYALAQAVRYAQNKGVLVVAAVSDRLYPCSYPGVIGVQQVDRSNYAPWPQLKGTFIDIVAPGIDVLSTIPGAAYGLTTGTSMATPHVSAAAAMYKLLNPEASAAEVSEALFQTTKPWGYQNEYGHGILNVESLLNRAHAPANVTRFIYPAVDSIVTGEVNVIVEVTSPATVDSVCIYFNEVDHQNLVARLTRPEDAIDYSIYEYRWDSLSVGELTGSHRLIAQGYHGSQAVGAEVILPITLRNEVTSGLLFQVLAPDGRAPHYASVQVRGWNGLTYEPVWYGRSSQDGVVRIPGTIALDLERYAVIVYGEFEDPDQIGSFVYRRFYEGPVFDTIDATHTVKTTFSALDQQGASLGPLALYSLQVRDDEGAVVALVHIDLPNKGGDKEIYLDKGFYDASAFLSPDWVEYLAGAPIYAGPTYFLLEEHIDIASTNSVTLLGTTARMVRPTNASWSQASLLLLVRQGWEEAAAWPLEVYGEELVVTPGNYYIDAATATTGITHFYSCGLVEIPDALDPFILPLDGTVSLSIQMEPSFSDKRQVAANIAMVHSRGYHVVEVHSSAAQARVVNSSGVPIWNVSFYHLVNGPMQFISYHLGPGDYAFEYAIPFTSHSEPHTGLIPFTLTEPNSKTITGYSTGGALAYGTVRLYAVRGEGNEQRYEEVWQSHFNSEGQITINEGDLSSKGNVLVAFGYSDADMSTLRHFQHFLTLEDIEDVHLGDCVVVAGRKFLTHTGAISYTTPDLLYFAPDSEGNPLLVLESSYSSSNISANSGHYALVVSAGVTNYWFSGPRYLLFNRRLIDTTQEDTDLTCDARNSARLTFTIDSAYTHPGATWYNTTLDIRRNFSYYSPSAPLDWDMYITPGDYFTSIWIARQDPERVGTTRMDWFYAMNIGVDPLLSLEPDSHHTTSIGGPFSAEMSLLSNRLTKTDRIQIATLISDVAGNRLQGALVQDASKPLTMSLELPDATSESEWPYVYPFLRIYKVDPQTGEETRVFNKSAQQYYWYVDEDLSALEYGIYRAELSISLGPEGTIQTEKSQDHYFTLVAPDRSPHLEQPLDGSFVAAQTFTIAGVAAPLAELDIFIYQGEPGEQTTRVTSGLDGTFAASVTVEDGEWSIIARDKQDRTSQTITVTVDTSPKPGELGFSAPSRRVNENVGKVIVTVTRSNGTDGIVTVAYKSTGGIATPGQDYSAVDGTLTFAAGEASQTFEVGIVDDTQIEGDENIILTLSEPTGGATLGLATTTITIADNDTPPPPPPSFFSPAALPSVPTYVLMITYKGGSLKFRDATVVIPPGAVPEAGAFSIMVHKPADLPTLFGNTNETLLLSDVFEVTALFDANFGNHRLRLCLPYDPSKLAQGHRPIAYWYDEESEKWVEQPTSIVEADGKFYACFSVSHLSKFTVLSSLQEIESHTIRLHNSTIPQTGSLAFSALGCEINIPVITLLEAIKQSSPEAVFELTLSRKATTELTGLLTSYGLSVEVVDGEIRKAVPVGPAQFRCDLSAYELNDRTVHAWVLKDGSWQELKVASNVAQQSIVLTLPSPTQFAITSQQVQKPEPKVISLTIGSRQVSVNNQPHQLDSAPFLRPGRTLVPVRFVSETLGAAVEWVETDNQVIIRDGDKEIVLTIGSMDVYVNGTRLTIDVAPEIQFGRTFVPLRFISEALGATVVYDELTKTITITR